MSPPTSRYSIEHLAVRRISPRPVCDSVRVTAHKSMSATCFNSSEQQERQTGAFEPLSGWKVIDPIL